MSAPKRLVLFVEGQGDADAVPTLVARLLEEQNASDCLFLGESFILHGLQKITGKNVAEWTKKLRAAIKRSNTGAVLFLMDGDPDKFEGKPFCAATVAKELCNRARTVGAGVTFSLACVFACKEYESWFLASLHTLAGKPLPPDQRPGVRAGAQSVPDSENTPRDAKGELGRNMLSGYKQTTDQGPLTRLLVADLSAVRAAKLRSFARLEHAVAQLVNAIRTGQHVATP
jgi:hypothetical protein